MDSRSTNSARMEVDATESLGWSRSEIVTVVATELVARIAEPSSVASSQWTSPRVWRLTPDAERGKSQSVTDSTRMEVDSNGVEAACSFGPLVGQSCDVDGARRGVDSKSIYTQNRADAGPRKLLVEINFRKNDK
jgi:hypothetical protein